MLARDVIVQFTDPPVPVDWSRYLRKGVRQDDERLPWCSQACRFVVRIRIRRMTFGITPVATDLAFLLYQVFASLYQNAF